MCVNVFRCDAGLYFTSLRPVAEGGQVLCLSWGAADEDAADAGAASHRLQSSHRLYYNQHTHTHSKRNSCIFLNLELIWHVFVANNRFPDLYRCRPVFLWKSVRFQAGFTRFPVKQDGLDANKSSISVEICWVMFVEHLQPVGSWGSPPDYLENDNKTFGKYQSFVH